MEAGIEHTQAIRSVGASEHGKHQELLHKSKRAQSVPSVIPVAFILPPMRWPFGSVPYTKPDDAISYAEFRSRSH
jgi:hypothetical protein